MIQRKLFKLLKIKTSNDCNILEIRRVGLYKVLEIIFTFFFIGLIVLKISGHLLDNQINMVLLSGLIAYFLYKGYKVFMKPNRILVNLLDQTIKIKRDQFLFKEVKEFRHKTESCIDSSQCYLTVDLVNGKNVIIFDGDISLHNQEFKEAGNILSDFTKLPFTT